MKANKPPILLNAEPFGFGPAAAIASVASLLASRDIVLGYIGEGHTHDLQRAINYKNRYDLSGLKAEARQLMWTEAAETYTFFITAMDFKAAEEAQRAGMRVIIYDALTWYWPNIPSVVKEADLYLAQDFFGVRERLMSDVVPYTKAKLVPPIVMRYPIHANRDVILLNMGGLQNPGWSSRDAIDYASVMIDTVRSILPGQKLQITTSKQIADALNDPEVKACESVEMQTILSKTKLAIMTSGLGNIYDAAAYSIPTLWLPPANDSQGRQLKLLQEHGLCDAAVSWDDLGLGLDLTLPQPEVLGAIANRVSKLKSDSSFKNRLSRKMQQASLQLNTEVSKSTGLLSEFGSEGAITIANEVLSYINKESYVSI